jgi:hypothetical protein
MNQLVAQHQQKHLPTARSAELRKRMYDLAHRIADGDGGPRELIPIAERAAEIAKRLPFVRSSDLREIIPRVETELETHKGYLREMMVLSSPASMGDIVREITELLLAIPGSSHVDLALLTQCAIEAVAREKPSLARLLVARERLLRTARFRPSVAEILEAFQVNCDSSDGWYVAEGLRVATRTGALAANYAKLIEALPQIENAEQEVRERRELAMRAEAEQSERQIREQQEREIREQPYPVRHITGEFMVYDRKARRILGSFATREAAHQALQQAKSMARRKGAEARRSEDDRRTLETEPANTSSQGATR